jgi:orotidine-5'-phosphate decarboxylase
MTRKDLFEQIKLKKSFLCVGLDTDLEKIPAHLRALPDPVFAFNKAIIDATHDLCVAYKPNTAFYETLGTKGWEALEKTVEYIEYIGNQHFIIADAKRGDIGNTSKMYAKAFFENMNCDAVTVAPYMGEDSVKPFLEFEGKWAIVLALTSNAGSADFQFIRDLFKIVLRTSQSWGTTDNLMFVVGATQGHRFEDVRRVAPDHFLLVPGVGAQGGDLRTVAHFGMNDHCGLLVNSSREIIYASNGTDFAEKARAAAQRVQQQMAAILAEKGIY